MRKKIIIPIIIILVAILIAFTASKIIKSNKDSIYLLGCEYIQNEDYQAAYDTLLAIEDYEDVSELLKEVRYQLGIASFQSDDIDTAWDYFNAVSKYKDSSEYLDEITYIRLLNAIEAGELDKADEYALEISGYKDVEDQKQIILFKRYMVALDEYDLESAGAIKNTFSIESLKQKADRVYEYSEHGYPILSDLYDRIASEGGSVKVKTIKCYQYSYNNNVEVPVYMIYTDYTDSSGNVSPRYIAYLDHTYYGFCNTIVRSELDMQDEAQLYAFLKIGPYWDEDTTFELSLGMMEHLNSVNK